MPQPVDANRSDETAGLLSPRPFSIPDVNLYSAARREQRDQGEFFIQQTFGELEEQLSGDANGRTITLPDISSWKKHGDAALEAVGGAAVLSTKNSRGWCPSSIYGGKPGAVYASTCSIVRQCP